MPHKPTAVLCTLMLVLASSAFPACRSVQRASLSRADAGRTDDVVPQRPPRATTDTGDAGGEVALAPAAQTPESQALATQTPAPGTDTRWPRRWGDDPAQRGIIIDMDPSEKLMPIHFSRYHQGRATPQDYDDAARLAAALHIEGGFKFKAEGPGSFIFMADSRDDQSPKDPPDMAFRFVSAETIKAEEPASEELQDHIELQRTWFTYRDPKAAQTPGIGSSGSGALGTIVLMPGIFGTPEPIVDAAERYWHTKGYAVLRMLSQPSRFTQHLRLPMIEGLEDAVVTRAARVSDDRVAECAYATSAALEHVFASRPGLGDKPTVLVGMSGGAMSLPTVYAYEPDRYDAAVLIAGGANFLRIMIESNYRDWIDALLIDFDPSTPAQTGMPTAAQLDTLSEAYLKESTLDAYHTATEMGGIPVLMLQGNSDKAVPTATGNTLYQQLNKPERWVYPVGHELIFAALPTQIPRIDRWLTERVLDQGQPKDTSGHGS